MLLVTEHPGSDQGAIGVVTLEDVVEVSLLSLLRPSPADR